MSTVKTQSELDAALTRGDLFIDIRSEAGVWLEVRASDSSTVTAYGSSTVRASGSSTVTAYDSSTVRASGSSTVTAYDSSTVTAYDSSTVTAYGSSTVRASGSSTVRAYGSSTVTAYDSSTVRASSSSTVRATPYVAVHLHSATVTVSGGVAIDVSALDLSNPKTWCAYTGVETLRGKAIVYKAVDDDLKAQYNRFHYPIGQTVEAADWQPTDACGNGLHFGPTPHHALAYNSGATRFLACEIRLSEAVGVTDSTPKIKARRCKVLYEVDLNGDRIDSAEQVAS